jgi:hypothetical protein
MPRENVTSSDVKDSRNPESNEARTSDQLYRKPRYTLEELLEGYTPGSPLADKDRSAWERAPPVGNEIW